MSNIIKQKRPKTLDSIDKRLLYELDLKSDASYQDLGDHAKIPKETAAFRVKRLVANGFIKNFRTTVHISRFGYYYYKFFFKFQQTTPQQETEIISYLKKHRSIAYLASLEGRYDVTFLVIAKNLEHLQEFLGPFKAKFGPYIREQEILTMTSVHRFNFRFFYEGGQVRHDAYPDDLKEADIDTTDYTIVRRLSEDARTKLTDIAKETKTHINVVRYHIAKLQKAGILGAPVLDVDFGKLGVEHYQVDLSLRDQTMVKPIIDEALTFPESTFATVTLGKYDLALEFAVRDNARLVEILNALKQKFADSIISSDTFVLHEHGVNWFPEKSPKP
ncbi:MAG: Lrp/AsnC family transcriptional regulator [Patescibacteria group bacterium]